MLGCKLHFISTTGKSSTCWVQTVRSRDKLDWNSSLRPKIIVCAATAAYHVSPPFEVCIIDGSLKTLQGN